MKPLYHYLSLFSLVCLAQTLCHAQQQESSSIAQLPSKYFTAVSKKSDVVSGQIDAKTEKILERLKKRQEKLKSKLYKIDSLVARNIFATADQRYKELEQKLNNPQKLTQYIPFLDTLKTSLKFLDKNKEFLAKASDMKQRLDDAINKVNGLENQLQKAEQVKQFLKQQKQFLKEQLEQFGFEKQLKRLNKDVYYYSRQLNEYKEIVKDPKKIERKAIDLLNRTKLFQDFMKKNSLLASLFRMPGDDPNDPAYMQSLAGLQTRAQVNQLIQNQIAAGGPGAQQQVQNNIQQAQGQLQQIKNKIAEYGASGSDDIMPEGFRPNSQRKKSFLKRLEYGTNTQSARGNGLLPVTSDLGLSVGYKLNDKSVIGIGASYKLGWGKDIRHIKITHEGLGFRGFVDYKLPKSRWKIMEGFWLTGGFEMNQYPGLKGIVFNLPFGRSTEAEVWQKAALLGLSKKLPVNLRFFKNTKMQLLWNLVAKSQVPHAQALVFRIGYNFQ